MTELEKLQKEIEPYINTLVIDDNYTVSRLVGVDDGEYDYLFVYDSRRGYYRQSSVGGFTPLKGFIVESEYDRLVKVWNNNNIEKAV